MSAGAQKEGNSGAGAQKEDNAGDVTNSRDRFTLPTKRPIAVTFDEMYRARNIDQLDFEKLEFEVRSRGTRCRVFLLSLHPFLMTLVLDDTHT